MNPSNTSEEPKFNIGDLVTYIYSDSSDIHPRVGLVVGLFKLEFELPEETTFTEYLYEYDIMWVGHNYASVMFEMFLEKYEHEK
tara:strand:- start:1034 stop:1285 length:252 start_codon:yes stop_codon:yes gene_type:complete